MPEALTGNAVAKVVEEAAYTSGLIETIAEFGEDGFGGFLIGQAMIGEFDGAYFIANRTACVAGGYMLFPEDALAFGHVAVEEEPNDLFKFTTRIVFCHRGSPLFRIHPV